MSMTLTQLQTEVQGHGFDQNVFGTRIPVYLNDGLREMCRKVKFYSDEADSSFTTTAGTATRALPADFAQVRSVRDTTNTRELTRITLRDIDASPSSTGTPVAYALDGASIRLLPVPDGVVNLSIRYWKLPAAITADADIPGIPEDYHNELVYYALARCFESEDDVQMAQYYDGKWTAALRDMAADLRFPDAEMTVSQVRSMWDDGGVVAGWGGGSYGLTGL